MKFIFADALDQVDPHYDFIADRPAPGRRPYWDDHYPHELLGFAPYDGILVSRGIVGDSQIKGKYSAGQSMRFLRVGARKFLRFNGTQFSDKAIFGDCGAFSYVKHDVPPYSSEEMADFYADGQFTHGCSVDHIIFEFDRNLRGNEGGSKMARARFDITLENAAAFRKAAKHVGPEFTPLGVVQGWSPDSMAEAARRLEKMGYSYVALGGMVPLNAASIHACLQAVRERISSSVRIHLLGFAKAEQIHEFGRYGIASFDTTSPLLRAFKDARANYYELKEDGGIDYFSAIRVPQALESAKLLRAVREGTLRQEDLPLMEQKALNALRNYDAGMIKLKDCLGAVLQYAVVFQKAAGAGELERESALASMRARVTRTLEERPWKRCSCPVCRAIGIEVAIFRGNNRNRRRGFHNLQVFNKHVKQTLAKRKR